MRIVGAAIILANLSGPADTPRIVWPAPAGIQQPPPRWAGPLNYTPKIVYDDQAWKTCPKLVKNHKGQLLGCATLYGPRKCTIILQSGMPPDLEDAVLKHEIGHCKGWPPDHPLK